MKKDCKGNQFVVFSGKLASKHRKGLLHVCCEEWRHHIQMNDCWATVGRGELAHANVRNCLLGFRPSLWDPTDTSESPPAEIVASVRSLCSPSRLLELWGGCQQAHRSRELECFRSQRPWRTWVGTSLGSRLCLILPRRISIENVMLEIQGNLAYGGNKWKNQNMKD